MRSPANQGPSQGLQASFRSIMIFRNSGEKRMSSTCSFHITDISQNEIFVSFTPHNQHLCFVGPHQQVLCLVERAQNKISGHLRSRISQKNLAFERRIGSLISVSPSPSEHRRKDFIAECLCRVFSHPAHRTENPAPGMTKWLEHDLTRI
jgi:hypothetical protein